jgi:hypothetical protein
MRRLFWVLGRSCFLLLLVSLAANSALAQLETATVSGQVVDPSGLSIHGAQVALVDIDRNTTTDTATNPSGLYTFPSVRPGRYRMEVTAAGFKIINVTGLTVNVQDHLEQNFKLTVGAVSESVTVEGGAAEVNTESAAVSTVVDQQFAENLPMNGRSFQTLIELTPGVVITPSNVFDSGQFSVNGQRAASNYWMVDGVSANFGVGVSTTTPGNGSAGALPSLSVLGGTNSLVSVDALQEFRIQTSTYAPEFGRTPGGQISIVTRSGTNQFHGTAFDYLRNDALDASNWFNGYTNSPPLHKAEERQNDFGGTFSGPILKNRTFFFFSYEGLRLRLPQTTITQVPDLSARQSAQPALQPYLNAFPFDPNQPDLGNGIAQFNASYSNPATLNAYSLRIDQKLGNKLTLFGRYNYSPSTNEPRGVSCALSCVGVQTVTIQTATVGATWMVSPTAANDLRFNYSRTYSNAYGFLDNFHGAVPLASLPFPAPYTSQDGSFLFGVFALGEYGSISAGGSDSPNLQRQINVTDTLSVQKGSHSLKFGVDFRRLSPIHQPTQYQQQAYFNTVADAGTGNLYYGLVYSQLTSALLFHNLGVFAQDTWRVAPRLTLTYGLRWDLDFSPSSNSGPSLLAVTGYNVNDLSTLALAPPGTPPYKTAYDNLAPRLGVAYQLSQRPKWQTVARGGFGIFYDLASSQVGNAYGTIFSYPFGSLGYVLGPPSGGTSTFPLTSLNAAPAPITAASLAAGYGALIAFDPNLKLPYTLQWSFALEQALGQQQTLSGSYIGSAGRRLIQSATVVNPSLTFPDINLVDNAATSDYDALQLQFQRRLSNGLQVLASYSWSHSIDDGSAGSYQSAGNELAPGLAKQNRGPSDFDIRNAFSAGLTYDFPAPRINPFATAILSGWSSENFILARSAPPDNIFYSTNPISGYPPTLQGAQVAIRPDVVPGESFYLYGSEFPGAKAFNPAAFMPPPADANGNPLRQGDLGRNALRGFGAIQWDFAIHRDFPIHESLKLQFRAEMFNVLNHPIFGPPQPAIDVRGFGLANLMLGQSLAGPGDTGSFSPLYQIGGPRSMQFALKLSF